jgi:GST-like protein
MIELHTANTPNGQKPAILLEELNLPYELNMVDLSTGGQAKPEFLRLSPNGKIPAIIDQETGIVVFESGVILSYLAEKSGQFQPTTLRGRYEVQEWLMIQMAAVGPIMGQLYHFRKVAPELVPYAIDRFASETRRLFGVLNRQLSGRDYICGEYSIADMAYYPWMQRAETLEIDMAEFSAVADWLNRVGDRPAVQRALEIVAAGKK